MVSGGRTFTLFFGMDVSKRSAYRAFTWATDLNRFGLEVVGLWPKINRKCNTSFASDLRVGIIFVLINILTFIPLLCSLLRVWGDLRLMVDNLEFTIGLISASMMLIIMRWKRTAVASIVRMMLEDWIELTVDAEKNIMVRQLQTARTLTICSYVVVLVGFIVVIILPSFGISSRNFSNLTDGNRLLPLQGYYFYDTDKSPLFELTYMVQGLTIFFVGVIYISVDTFLGLCIFHIFARNMEDAFSLLLLGFLTYFIVVFCLSTFLFLTMTTDDATVNSSLSVQVFGLVCSSLLFSHALLYCGGGEFILHHYEMIYRAVFDFEWYKLESRRARSLMIFMIRIKEPTRITAGKLVPLTLATFCSMVETSVGYISLLLAMRD